MISISEKTLIDAVLQQNDDDCIRRGEPPLSVLVRHDDGSPSTAFWWTVKKHGLRQPGETDAELIRRCMEAAYNFHQGRK